MGEIAINPTHNVFKKYKQVIYVNPYLLVSSLDADVSAFVSAANITDEVQKSAINSLVIGLKNNGLWTKMKAIYPIVGGTDFSHKWNLKDPRDLDVAFRLTFQGPWVHSANGMKPSVAFADTKFNLLSNATQNNLSMAYYSRTNISEHALDMGLNSNCYLSYSYNGSHYSAFNSAQTARGTSMNPSLGLYIGSRINSTVEKYYHNNSLVNNLTVNSNSALSLNVFLGGSNSSGSLVTPSSKQCAFSSIGDGLTDAEASNLYTVVQAFQTALGRQV